MADSGSYNEYLKKNYESQRNKRYTELRDTEVMLENARANALKYTGNQIAAQGMGGTGYAQNANTGIHNSYMNALGSARNAANTDIKDINLAEQQDQMKLDNDRFQSVTTMISQAKTNDQMNNLMSDYGYGAVGADGKFVFGEKPEDMSDDNWNQLKYYYNLQKDYIDDTNPEAEYGALYNNLDSLANSTYIGTNNNKGQINKVGDYFKKELETLWHYTNAGSFKNGDVIKIVNESGETIYYKYGKDGFRASNESEYNNSEDSYTIEYESSSNGTTFTKGKKRK